MNSMNYWSAVIEIKLCRGRLLHNPCERGDFIMRRDAKTCIICPMGCHVEFFIEPDNSLENISGYECKKGKKYAASEFKNPLRVLTTTFFIEGAGYGMLPVRTDRPVPKGRLKELMKTIASIKVVPPIEAGHVKIQNILDTGVDLISTGSLK